MHAPRRSWIGPALLALAVALGIADLVLAWGRETHGWDAPVLTAPVRQVFIYAILALGLNVVTGFTGMLHLGMAAFMAIGAYAFAILTCDIYPFQIGFWWALIATVGIGMFAGLLLGAPTMALRGDYLAIVTLGFGEIVQDVLKNLDPITQGTQGINPLPPPSVPGYRFQGDSPIPWYFLYLGLVVIVVLACRNLEQSRVGRAWLAIRGDELAARCMGIPAVRMKMLAFAIGAGIAALSGALFASIGTSTADPSTYDFTVSVLALCIVIVGGMGSLNGVLIGALAMIGFSSILLPAGAAWLQRHDYVTQSNVFGNPNNWKFLIFGLVLVVMMRVRPDGILPRRIGHRRKVAA